MKTRKEISELIEQYLDKELTTADEASLLKLIEENTFVKEEFLLRQRIDRAIRNKEIIELRKELKSLYCAGDDELLMFEPTSYFRRNWYKMAAAILLTMGIGYLIHFVITNRNPSDNPALSSHHDTYFENPNILDEPSKIGKEEKSTNFMYEEQPTRKTETGNNRSFSDQPTLAIADNFKESDYLESFIDNYRSTFVKIIQPAPAAVFDYGSEILFKWQHEGDTPLTIKIYDNTENLVISISRNIEYLMKEQLSPGLYYWKLETDEDLLSMNKFIIR